MIGIKKNNKFIKKNKGVTLIEMLTAVGIFVIIIGAISGLFISAIRSQRRVLATQEISNQISYVMEYMSRTLRMAKKDTNGSCIGAGNNYLSTHSGEGIKFINHLQNDDCQEFYFDTTTYQIKHVLGTGEEFELTSAELKVNYLKFYLSGVSEADSLQPRVTISLEVESKRSLHGEPPKLQIQSTISQRPLDIQ